MRNRKVEETLRALAEQHQVLEMEPSPSLWGFPFYRNKAELPGLSCYMVTHVSPLAANEWVMMAGMGVGALQEGALAGAEAGECPSCCCALLGPREKASPPVDLSPLWG